MRMLNEAYRHEAAARTIVTEHKEWEYEETAGLALPRTNYSLLRARYSFQTKTLYLTCFTCAKTDV